MYEQFFQFKEKPFNMTPDPKYYYPSGKHRAAMDSLIYAVSERKGFVVVTGEIGSGKTTVCRTLLNKLGDRTTVAMINNTKLTPKQLIATILDEYEIPYNEWAPKRKLLSRLNHFLIEQLAQDHNVVLIIDEAQNLNTSCLEEVRMLSNLETEKDKLIQIILMGQPELRDTLKLESMTQFKQRVAIHYHLYPLNEDETNHYIKHRVRIARNGSGDQPCMFSDEAVTKIYEFSGGVPRIINNVCDNALLTAYANGTHTIDLKIAGEVTGEIFEAEEGFDEIDLEERQDDALNAALHLDHDFIEHLDVVQEHDDEKPSEEPVNVAAHNEAEVEEDSIDVINTSISPSIIENVDNEKLERDQLDEERNDCAIESDEDFIRAVSAIDERRPPKLRKLTQNSGKGFDVAAVVALVFILIFLIYWYASVYFDLSGFKEKVSGIITAIMNQSRNVIELVSDDEEWDLDEKIDKAIRREEVVVVTQKREEPKEIRPVKIVRVETPQEETVPVEKPSVKDVFSEMFLQGDEVLMKIPEDKRVEDIAIDFDVAETLPGVNEAEQIVESSQ
ncbi:ExeA family protein [Candidatus Omnitrophota bacterium]